MAPLYIPSTTLLRTFLKPDTVPKCTNQLRRASNYMPRHKYAAVTRLDKYHRTQRDILRKERQQAIQRADAITVTTTTTKDPSQPQQSLLLPFTITRTPSSQLPVYESAKAGGSRHITTIRKTSGDLDVLAAQLRTVLNMPEHVTDQKGNKKASVAINRLNGHVVVRGWRGEEVKAWLGCVGF